MLWKAVRAKYREFIILIALPNLIIKIPVQNVRSTSPVFRHRMGCGVIIFVRTDLFGILYAVWEVVCWRWKKAGAREMSLKICCINRIRISMHTVDLQRG